MEAGREGRKKGSKQRRERGRKEENGNRRGLKGEGKETEKRREKNGELMQRSEVILPRAASRTSVRTLPCSSHQPHHLRVAQVKL